MFRMAKKDGATRVRGRMPGERLGPAMPDVQGVMAGVNAADPRNAGPIAHFRPKEVTAESAAASLRAANPRLSEADIAARVARLMAKIASGQFRPPPPISQSLADVADPWHGLGTHPDIVEAMWRLDDALPERCRWVFWGKPALVHPLTGVVFAVGIGTIGYAMRLPAEIRAAAAPERASARITRNRTQTFDVSGAGPEWRFMMPPTPAEWYRAAYEDAGRDPA